MFSPKNVLWMGVLLAFATKSFGKDSDLIVKNKSENFSIYEKFNFLYGIAKVGVEFEKNSQCGQELQRFLNAFENKEIWALKVLNSFGNLPQDFIWGNYLWFQSRELCEELNKPFHITFSKNVKNPDYLSVVSPFPLQFSLIYMNFSTPYFTDLKLIFERYIHVGLCLPQSCNSSILAKYSDLFFQKKIFEIQQQFDLELNSVNFKNPKFSWTFLTTTESIIFLIASFSLVVLSLIAELQRRSSKKSLQNPCPSSLAEEDQHLKLKAFFQCFCIHSNVKKSFTLETKTSKNFLSCIAGLRTIVCLWITVFHVYYFSLYTITNLVKVFVKFEYLAYQPISQAMFYVDIFFIISSFLLVNNFFSNESQLQQIRENSLGKNLRLILNSILKRYLRLTPVLGITILLSSMVSDFLNSYSPFLLGENSGIHCKDNWWRNLLYIQNFSGLNNMCCSWTWYLACDMQYFSLLTVLLYGYTKKPKTIKIIFILLTLGSVVVAWYCNYYNGVTFQIDIIHGTLNELYIKPWVRIIPYMGGALLGWLQAVKCQNNNSRLSNHNNNNKKKMKHDKSIENVSNFKLKNVNSICGCSKVNKSPNSNNNVATISCIERNVVNIHMSTSECCNIDHIDSGIINNNKNNNNNSSNNKDMNHLNDENSFEYRINENNKKNSSSLTINKIKSNNNKNTTKLKEKDNSNNNNNGSHGVDGVGDGDDGENHRNIFSSNPNQSHMSMSNSHRDVEAGGTRNSCTSSSASGSDGGNGIDSINDIATYSKPSGCFRCCRCSESAEYSGCSEWFGCCGCSSNRKKNSIIRRWNGMTEIPLNEVWLAVFWFVCICFYVTTNFMSYWRNMPTWLVSTIMSLGKLLFSLCCGHVILLCSIGYAHQLNSVLSARLFVFLNKFCYSIYMIAPTIVFAVFGLRNMPTTFNEVSSAMDFFGVIIVAIPSAFLMVILIEIPIQNLVNLFFHSINNTKQNHYNNNNNNHNHNNNKSKSKNNF